MDTHPMFNLQYEGRDYNIHDLDHLIEKSKEYSWLKEIIDFIQAWNSDTDHIDVFTSGSTSSPKNLQLKKEQMVSSAKLTIDFFKLNPGDTALLCLPVKYIAGKMMVVRAMVGGLQLMITESKSDPFNDLTDQQFPIDFAAMTPMQVEQIFQNKHSEKLRSLNTLIIGGSPLEQVLKKRLSRFENEIYSTYGMTETITHIAVQKVSQNSQQDYYTAIPGVTFSIDDRSCLVIDAEHLESESIITNDIVELIDQNNFRWMGRYDFIINSGGVKINPEEVELKIRHAVKDPCYISSVQDKVLGEKVVLVIERSKAMEDLSALKEKFTTLLEKYEIPKEIIYVDQFNYTTTGKLIRKKADDILINK